ncbi:hypothetical protein Fcan01_24515 [Folsomia candida]|uniref:Uncharacterized protein n=1 Tax=Folsomia candida TaxID=158441 RepID=A0A226D6J1_FOLCA|nr:hypothetical protein Fcan01_24515 [Folsomia candida]
MFCKILEFSCTWKVIPYNWNGVMKRFSPIDPTDLRGRVAIKLHSGIMYAVTIFSFVRLIMNVGKDRDEFPLMMKIVNVSWLLASIQVSVIFLNNWALRGDLMQYGNRVLEKIVKQGSQGKYPYSGALWTGMVLLFLNPLPHGLVAMHTPCAPNLLSSIVLSCACIGDHDHAKFGYGLLLLMGCWELYFMTVIFIQAFLAWAFVYLGVSSGTREMNGMRSMGIPLEVGIRTYLDLQRIINLLNVACKPYLATFPILLMSICSILLFGSIRLWDVDFRADTVFPFCAIRCAFETFSQILMAGQMRWASDRLMQHWEKGMMKARYRKMFTSVAKSGVKVKAGIFFTFSRWVVVISVHNFIEQTLNLLVSVDL